MGGQASAQHWRQRVAHFAVMSTSVLPPRPLLPLPAAAAPGADRLLRLLSLPVLFCFRRRAVGRFLCADAAGAGEDDDGCSPPAAAVFREAFFFFDCCF